HLAEFLEHPNDPDIMRIMEGFVLLSSGVRSKIDDTCPEVSHETLARIWPHTLRSVPPATIIQFAPHQDVHQGVAHIPKDTPVTAAEGEQNLQFRTCRDLPIEPFMVLDKQIQKTREYSDIVLTLQQTGNTSPVWSGGKLHFFLGSDPNRAAQLSLWLDMQIEEVYLRTTESEIRLRSSDFLGWGENFRQTLLP
ncbi:type VI secretion system baseplate subunit TssF, partial [Xenorhabdus sp. M]